MLSLLTVLLSLSFAALSVKAHGYVQDIVVGSTHYTGYLPYSDPYYNPVPQRIVRPIPGNGPVTDLSLIDVQCNGYSDGGVVGSSPAPIFATVSAGSQMHLNWTTWPDSHVGPMITYMAKAPSDITAWLPGTAAVWFKVAEAGKTADGQWASTDELTATDSVYTFTVPPKLQPGQYIVRHEIIALHAAWTYPGAQVYPSCIQIQVTGSGTAFPTSGFVSFPGAYTATTPGIVYDVYTNTSAYPIPGPAVLTSTGYSRVLHLEHSADLRVTADRYTRALRVFLCVAYAKIRQGYEDSDLTDLPPYHSDSPFAHLARIDLDVLTFSSPIPLTSPPTTISLPVMSTTVAKEFSEVPKLSSDGSNYRIWLGRVERATGACEAEDLLIRAADSSSAAELKLNKQMLNAITGKFPDSLFKKYISVTEVHSVMSGLKTEFGMSTAASEAWTEAKLFSLRCTDERKVRQHLDQLSELKDKLSEMNVKIEDRTYINAITTSIPRSFAPVVTAIATATDIYNSTLATGATRRIVTSAEIIKALRAEADSRAVLKTTDKSVAANAAFTNGRGGTRGRGRGSNRGRGVNSNKNSTHRSEEDLTCFKCGGKGHRSPECPSKKQFYQKTKKSEAASTSTGTSDGKVKTDAKPKDGATKDSSASAVIAAPESSAHIEEAWSACAMIPYEEEIVIDCSDLAAQEEVHIPDTYHAFAGIIESGRRVDIFDSGASRHMTPHLDRLSNFRTTAPHQIRAANLEVFYSHGVGDMLLHLPAENGGKHIRLKGVLHAPKMHATLISLGVVEAAGFAWLGYDGNLIICNQHNDIVISVPREDHLYRIFYDSAHASLATSAVQLSLFEIHKRLGHVNYGYLKAMIQQNRLTGITLDPRSSEEVECKTCLAAKARRAPISSVRQSPLAEKFGEHLHMDIWGPASVLTIDRCRYALTIVDDATRWLEMPLMRVKSKAFGKYVALEARLQTQHGIRIKTVQSDQGGEFLSTDMDAHLERAGTVRKLTVHDTPEHNGVAERTHLTIFNGVRAALAGSGLPKWLWGKLWRTSSTSTTGRLAAHCKVSHRSKHAMDTHRTSRTCTNGGALSSSLLRLTRSSMHEGAKHVGAEDFYRTKCRVQLRVSARRGGHDFDIGPTSNVSDTAPPPPKRPRHIPEPERSPSLEPGEIREPENPDIVTGKRKRTPSAKLCDIASGRAEGALTEITIDESEESEVLAYSVGAAASDSLGFDPRSVAEAKRRPDWPKWQEAMRDEIRRLESRKAWVYVDPPPRSSGHNVVGSKWVFRMKRDARGEVTGYCARLVAQGFTQVEGVDYFADDTYAAVCKLASIRVILSVAARNGWFTHQVDVKSAYLYGKLREDEKIYMRPPPDIELDGLTAGQILLLLVALYGLHQSGRRWYVRLRKILESFKLVRLEHDHAVFYRRHPDGEISIIFLHVDDMTLVCSLFANLLRLKEMIQSELEITDNGELHWLLGIEVRRNLEKHTIALSQRAYIESIISRYGFSDAKPLAQPMDPHVRLSIDQCPVSTAEYAAMRDKPYLEALGALQYVSVATRPDITFAVGQLAQFGRNPGVAHWNALKRVYQYLKGTADVWLMLGGSEDNDICGKECFSGVCHEGDPQGKIEQIGGIECYVAIPTGEYPRDKVVLFLTDVFGIPLINNRLLVDDFARNGYRTVMPDLFEGDPMPSSELERAKVDRQAWLGKHGPDSWKAIVDNVVAALKESGVTWIATTGYCYGAPPAFYLAFKNESHATAIAHPSRLEIPVDLERYRDQSRAPIIIQSCDVDSAFPKEAQAIADEILGAANSPLAMRGIIGRAVPMGSQCVAT
ncbi:hypothetical protein A0H81_11842 [Grifola frondosa]|uniref:lytic cellulose monooxygenase (C4-dehydrogenating) n=1 Tax=Grifola frondosa TaxID=5627 RepID=A0A1C7LUR1_GRIFR|nr:hypothetical protein A0H81_11842 [Grifola frondosa]